MRIAEIFIILLTCFALSACVSGTVEYDGSDGWEPDEESSTEQPASEDESSERESTENDNLTDPDMGVADEPTTDSPPDTEAEPECPSGEDMCVETCVDTTTSVQHCGGCDMPCSGGMLCSGGQCVENTEVAAVLLETNAARAAGADCGAYGVKDPATPLEGDAALHEAAQIHAEDMAANNFFDHTGSDGSSFADRVRRTDFVGFPIGENIAAGYGSPSAAVSGWIDSDGHCRNLMNDGATKIGIGYTTGGPYGTLWVQVFGR